MISYLKGKIISKKDKFIVLLTDNTGYKVFLSKKSLGILDIGKELELFCFLNVKENGLELYGFLSEGELEFFEILDSIRGVGPKAALEISSLGPIEKIRQRILERDKSLLSGIPGIGQKKAEAIILELSGKVAKEPEVKDEAYDTLLSLGFLKEEVKKALKEVSAKNGEERVKEALKILGKNH